MDCGFFQLFQSLLKHRVKGTRENIADAIWNNKRSFVVNLPEQGEFDKQVESAFHCMLLACYCTVDPGLHFYAYFFGQSIRAYSAKAISVGKKIVIAL